MKKNQLALTALSLLISAFALNFSKPDQPTVGYVQIEGQKSGRLKGNPGSPEWDINIISFNYTEEDKAHHITASVKFSKPVDETSQGIQNCFNQNQNLSDVKFTLFNMQGKKKVVYETIELKNATIKQIDQNGANETISLQFQTIQTNYN